MGDMEVAIASGEDKIMTSSSQDMKVSISFGKYENDSLSWEKFSSFSPNKYLEEVEKCATPGSVAQKKAYFESHYKKIAERNAEIILLEQEKQLEKNASFRPSLDNSGNTVRENERSVVVESSACYVANGECTSEKDKDKTVNSIATEEVNETCNHDEHVEETMTIGECNVKEELNSLKMEKLEEIVCVGEEPELIVQVEHKEKPEEVVCIEEEVKEDVSSPSKETKEEKDQHLIKKTDKHVQTRSSSKPNQVTKKPVASKVATSRKTQPSKEKSMIKATTTNKAASPVSTKASKFSTPRVSKPSSSTISSMSTSRSSVKKENVSTLPKKKQTAPKTLHSTSLNLNQPSSDPTALATTRKSLIMERMGDKEIVRRAFKSFQKSFDKMKEQDTAPKQVPAKATSVPKLVTTGLKENGRLAKSFGTEKKVSNSHRSSSFVPKSNRTAEKQEISRSGAKAVEKIRLPAKPKAEVTNANSRRQSLDPKARSIRGPLSQGSSDEVL